MQLVEVKLTNFRGYEAETSVKLDPLTVLIGRNDAGKSSILDALDIFFNDASIDKGDCCVHSGASEVRIACVFEDLPEEIIVDELHPTSLDKEYLLREDGRLEIVRLFNCSAQKGKASGVFARAFHPSKAECSKLLGKKITELKKIAADNKIDVSEINQSISSQLRQAIWHHWENDLCLAPNEVDLSSDSGKKVWVQIQRHLPVYAIFKSDRASTDQDAEAQDPMKAAIKETIRNHEKALNGLIGEISAELEKVAEKTVEKLREMSPELANELKPQVKNKNWDSLFAVSLTGEDEIPLNKRGSGTRRLVLLNFFRAKAETASGDKGTGVIYAIEEPETSQHPNHQIMLLEAIEDLVEQGRCQVLITTHTPTLARRVDQNRLRLVAREHKRPCLHYGKEDTTLKMIKSTLGVLPDHDVQVFFGVEGKHDIEFLRRISHMLSATESDIPDLDKFEQEGKLVFVPLGGSSLELWVSRLAHIDRPEFYLTDRDVPPPSDPKYSMHMAQWTARGCTAWATSKRELENYLHIDAIKAIEPTYGGAGADFDDVPMLFAEAVHSSDASSTPWHEVPKDKQKSKASRAKKRLNTECVDLMTPELLNQSDPGDEIRTWLRQIGAHLS